MPGCWLSSQEINKIFVHSAFFISHELTYVYVLASLVLKFAKMATRYEPVEFQLEPPRNSRIANKATFPALSFFLESLFLCHEEFVKREECKEHPYVILSRDRFTGLTDPGLMLTVYDFRRIVLLILQKKLH